MDEYHPIAYTTIGIVIREAWFDFSSIRQLEPTCLVLCRECRHSVSRTVNVRHETPRELWSRRSQPVSDAREAVETAAELGLANDEQAIGTSPGRGMGGTDGGLGALDLLRAYEETAEDRDAEGAFVDPRKRPHNAPRMTIHGGIRTARQTSSAAETGRTQPMYVNSTNSTNFKKKSIASGESTTSSGGATKSVHSWRSAGDAGSSGRRKSRVPVVRPTRMNWQLSVSELLAPDFDWPEGLKRIVFWPLFDDSVRNVRFPDTMEDLIFGYRFNCSLGRGEIRWPQGLKTLELKGRWNQPLVNVKETWPSSLECLRLSSSFNQPLLGNGVSLPSGLRELSLGTDFNKTLSGVQLPRRLEKLILSEAFNQPLDGVTWPLTLRELWFGKSFDQELADARFPPSLEKIVFGEGFHRVLHASDTANSLLPPGVRELWLAGKYSEKLERYALPESLCHFRCNGPCVFSTDMAWPSDLKALHGAGRFEGDVISLPPMLEKLTTSANFAQPLDNFMLPSTMRVLKLGDGFHHSLDGVKFPAGLEGLYLGAAFNHDIRGTCFPQGLKCLYFAIDSKFNQDVTGLKWPCGLERLYFGNCFNQSLEYAELPEHLEVLHFGFSFSHSLQGVGLPKTLRILRLPPAYPRWHLLGLYWPGGMRLTVGSTDFHSRRSMISWAVGESLSTG